MNDPNQPLLTSLGDDHQSVVVSQKSAANIFNADEDDMQQIDGVNDFLKCFFVESVKLWYLAGPAIFTSICQYSLGAITQVFAGHVGTIQLAAVSVENSVIAGLAFGIMLGMGSALETLCGQAYGAGQINMLGIYMQRSWIILITTSLPLMLVYIFATPILKFIGQTQDISKWAGTFAVYMIPQLFAYAVNFPTQKFLQAQSKIMVMAAISAVAIVLHAVFSWWLMLRLEWGLLGGAIVLNASWWFIVIAHLGYVFSGTCGQAWTGFSVKAFQDLWGFVKLSCASAVMLCLEFWYMMILILFAGYLKNAEVAVDALSICMNISGWTIMVALGFNAAISVRVSNELGAGHPRSAKFSMMVVTLTSLIFGLLLAMVFIIARNRYPALFTEDSQVQQVVYELTPLLSTSIVINSLQPTLSGVAVGAGWQAYVAYVNIACYYIFGIPLGLTLGYVLDMGVKGIWYGMLSGTIAQTCALLWMVSKTNWTKEASIAGDRIKQWGGERNSIESS